MTGLNIEVSPENAIVYDVGACIYCGSKEGLTREHVIPFGLGGGIILHNASCAKCSEITKKFENTFLRNDLGMFRAQTKFPTRNKKDRPTHDSAHSEENGKVQVNLEEMPTVLALPVFENVPGGFGTAYFNRPQKYDVRFFTSDQHKLDQLLQEHGNMHFVRHFHMDAFLRVLAKIAHGLFTVEFETSKMAPYLPDLILNNNQEGVWNLIGRAHEPLPDARDHTFKADGITYPNGSFVPYIRIRLFSSVPGTPTYGVIAGGCNHVRKPIHGAHLKQMGGKKRS